MTNIFFDLFKIRKHPSMYRLKHKTNREQKLKHCEQKNYNYSESELESGSNSESINSGIFIFFILYLNSSK